MFGAIREIIVAGTLEDSRTDRSTPDTSENHSLGSRLIVVPSTSTQVFTSAPGLFFKMNKVKYTR